LGEVGFSEQKRPECKLAKIKQKLNDAKIDINYIIKIDVTMNNHSIRTTLSLPAELLEATDRAVSEGKAKSRNEFVARAIRNELATQKRAEIDAEFAHMAKDTEYQAEAEIINQEFAHSDWEALQLGESQK
jgi:Arc/MetJ-type ribon-helix-helix transcriptional regulator